MVGGWTGSRWLVEGMVDGVLFWLAAMTSVQRHRYTFSDYLHVEEMSADVKHEYIDGDIVAMAGGTIEHAALASAINGMLMALLRGTGCRPYSSDLRIRIPSANVATYADATVVCDPVERAPDSPSHVTNPRVVIEVLSPSTEEYDRTEKRLYYQQLESLREYVLIAQDRRRVEVWSRSDTADWVHTTYGAGQTAVLGSIRFELDVDELYALAGVAAP